MKFKRGEMRKIVYDLHLSGMKTAQIARHLNIAAVTVWYHKRRLEKERGISILDRTYSNRKFKHVDWAAVQKDIDLKMGHLVLCKKYSFAKATLTRAYKRGVVRRPKTRNEMSLEEISVLWDGKDGSAFRRSMRVKFIKKYGHRCMVCGLSDWCGKPIPLEIDHIDGCVWNNKTHNLRMLCPNCHAQTPTYGGKNKGKTVKPDGVVTTKDLRRSANGKAPNLSSS